MSGFVQHFAAGVVFAAVAGEVLPSLRDQHSLRAVLIGFSIGVAALLYLVTEELLLEAHETPDTNWQIIAFFAGFVILFAIEG